MEVYTCYKVVGMCDKVVKTQGVLQKKVVTRKLSPKKNITVKISDSNIKHTEKVSLILLQEVWKVQKG